MTRGKNCSEPCCRTWLGATGVTIDCGRSLFSFPRNVQGSRGSMDFAWILSQMYKSIGRRVFHDRAAAAVSEYRSIEMPATLGSNVLEHKTRRKCDPPSSPLYSALASTLRSLRSPPLPSHPLSFSFLHHSSLLLEVRRYVRTYVRMYRPILFDNRISSFILRTYVRTYVSLSDIL